MNNHAIHFPYVLLFNEKMITCWGGRAIFLVLWNQCILSLPVGLFYLIKIWPMITKHCYYIVKFSSMAKADLNIVMWELKWREVEPILFASEASPLTRATSLGWILYHTPGSVSAYSRNYLIKICFDNALLLNTIFLTYIFFSFG